MPTGQIFTTDDPTKINQLFSEGDKVQLFLDTSVAVNDMVILLANGTIRPISPVHGRAVLVAGTVTVLNTEVAATTDIIVSSLITGGIAGFLNVANVVAGVRFDIVSSAAGDTSTVAFMFVR